MRCKTLLLAAAALLAGTPLRAEPFDPAELLSSGLPLIREWLTGERGREADHHVAAISAGSASLAFHAEGRSTLHITLAEGRAFAGGRSIGRYSRGGGLEASWRELVLEASRRGTPGAVALARDWRADGAEGEELETAASIRARLRRLGAVRPHGFAPRVLQAGGDTVDLSDLSDPAALEPALRAAGRRASPDLRVTVPGGQARLGNVTIGSDETVWGHLLVLHGSAEVYGRLAGNVAAVDGDVTVHPGGVVDGDVLAVGGTFRDAGGEVRGPVRVLPAPGRESGREAAEPRSALGLAAERAFGLTGVFLTLLALGFGLVLFGRPQLEVVADTVSFSFGRAFVVGLLAQMLVVPTFGMLVVGLVLSVVGVLLLPFAVIAFGLLLVVGVVGGILAVAHAMGETYTRRRLALGHAGSPNSYRYVLIGLTALGALWAAWVVFGWVPVAGTLILLTAALVTWLLGTVGLGATLLSHAGLRESFAGRLVTPEALTDEFLWATPQFGVPAVKRPHSRTPTPLR